MVPPLAVGHWPADVLILVLPWLLLLLLPLQQLLLLEQYQGFRITAKR
jgi:hypothetical protein